jgi:MFS family permease
MKPAKALSGRRPGAFKGPLWYPMAILSACYLLANVDRLMVSLLVTPIEAALKMSDAQIGFFQGIAFCVFATLGAFPLARLADRGNRPRIMALCTLAWSIATSACGFATSQIGLFWARAVVAAGEGGLPPTAYSFFPDIYLGRTVIRANAAFQFAVYVGGGLALLLGGTLYASAQHWRLAGTPLADLAPWQLVFVVIGAPGVLLGALVWLTLREPPDIDRIRPPKPHGVMDSMKYIVARRAFQGPYVLAYCASLFLSTMNLAWVPAMLMRNYGMHEQDVGLIYGPVYMIAGILGGLSVGAFVGKAHAHNEPPLRRVLKILLIESSLLVVPAILAPLANNVIVVVALMAASIFLYAGVIVLLLNVGQLVYPAGMRAQALTILNVPNGLLGAGAGPFLVGLVSDALPAGPRSLSSALSIVAAVVAPLIVLGVYSMGRAARRDLQGVLAPSAILAPPEPVVVLQL